MKTFLKRSAMVAGLLFVALLCMGIVYIDNIKHYWQFSGGFIRLIVNTNAQASITIDTNTLAIGFNTNNTARSLVVQGRQPATNSSGNGTSAATSGQIAIIGGTGGQTVEAGSANGGAGATIVITGGIGVIPPLATTNATGSAGGTLNFTGGAGGTGAQVATNASTGGGGGSLNFAGGAGGVPTGTAPTNTVGGRGGSLSFQAGVSGLPATGWARKGGQGGDVTFLATDGRNSTRTNGGIGGIVSFTTGNGGNASTSGNGGAAGDMNFITGNGGSSTGGGNPEPGGNMNLSAGNGSTGATNSNGGNIYLTGGAPGSGAIPGDVIIGRPLSGTVRGGLMVGPLLGGSASITNILGGSLELDFGSVAAGTVEDLPITVTGVTSNNCAVALSVAWQSASGNGGVFSTYNSNDVIYVRCANNNLVTAIDPPPSTFTVIAFRIR